MGKIAVFGLGKSGLSALAFLKKLNKDVLVVNAGEVATWQDSDPLLADCECLSQDNELAKNALAKCEEIILSPGIPREHSVLAAAVSKNVPIINEVELAYRNLKANIPIIAVTGTNGKTTTVTMLAELLKSCGKKVFLGGNIGTPFCDYHFNEMVCDYIVLELSSFQLESLASFKAYKSALLNITMSHGERYDNVEDYSQAKFHIADRLTKKDQVYVLKEDQILQDWSSKLDLNVISISGLKEELRNYIYSLGLSLDHFKLKGVHNLINLGFSLHITSDLNLSREGVQKFIDSFQGVEHRLSYLPSKQFSFPIYNDAKSTNWQATLTAVNSFEEKVVLILGGQLRGGNDEVDPYIDQLQEKVSKILLIGQSSELLAKGLRGKIPFEKLNDLAGVKKYLMENELDSTLVFSPAFPSFDQFKNYVQRGESFIQLLG